MLLFTPNSLVDVVSVFEVIHRFPPCRVFGGADQGVSVGYWNVFVFAAVVFVFVRVVVNKIRVLILGLKGSFR